MLEVDTPDPDFTLPNQDGEPVTLSSLRGKPVVLYLSQGGHAGLLTQ